jgi:hypothetical protein
MPLDFNLPSGAPGIYVRASCDAPLGIQIFDFEGFRPITGVTEEADDVVG